MKGYVYKICNVDESIVYIGSTQKSLKERWEAHKSDYKRWIEGKVGCSAMIYHHFKEFGVDEFSIHLISEHEIKSKDQLRKFEQLVIDKTQNTCNKKKAKATKQDRIDYKKQYREANKEQEKRYREANKDKIAERQRQYREATNKKHNCDCGGKYITQNLKQHLKTKKHIDWQSTN